MMLILTGCPASEDDGATPTITDPAAAVTTDPPTTTTTELVTTTADPNSDSAILVRLQALLDEGDFGDIDFSVDDGVVTMSGSATDQEVRLLLLRLNSVAGVSRVDDEILRRGQGIKGIYRADRFETSSSELSSIDTDDLDELANQMQLNATLEVVIEGHTDDIGPAAGNLRLSQTRADAARTYLISKGISGDRITAVGKGETDPDQPNNSDANRARNRRIEVITQ